MDLNAISMLLMVGGTSFAVAFCALWAFARIGRTLDRQSSIFSETAKSDVVFLFDDQSLVDATSQAKRMISKSSQKGTDWTRFASVFLPRFPDLAHKISGLSDLGEMTFESDDGSAILKAEWRRGLARLVLVDQISNDIPGDIDQQSLNSLEHELKSLRAIIDHSPCPAWREAKDGTITWANAAYLDLADLCDPATRGAWPPSKVFETDILKESPDLRRQAVVVGDNAQKAWFNCGSTKQGDEYFMHAVPIDDIVKAEESLQDFRQSMSRAFAQLPTGLAVFDGAKRLTTFNPAFLDLTKLPFSSLSNRPSLGEFLDHLRNSNLIPEPKDYSAWRARVETLLRTGSSDVYEEDWYLPSGQVLRVKGCPFEDTSMMLFVEDVSHSISSAREYNEDLRRGQAVADSIDDAVAVITAQGKIGMTNSAYDKLWGVSDEPSKKLSVLDATKIWHSRCAPSPIWGEFRDFAAQTGDRVEWSGDARLWDGRRMSCHFVPLGGGTTMVKFKVNSKQTSMIGQRLQITDRPALDA